MVHKLLYRIVYALFTILFFTSCTKEYSCENCIEANKLPIAIAGSDTVIDLPLDSLLLDGSKSSDPDGKISAWHWTKIAGPASFTLVNISSEKTLVRNLKEGIYQFELKVNDDKGASAKDTVQVKVHSIVTTNHPPIACAGADQTITFPTSTVNLDGTCSSDPDNNINTYQWTKIAGPSYFNITNTNTIQTQVSNLIEGIYQFELKVTDAAGLFSNDTVLVTVNSIVTTNHPPIACAGADQTIALPGSTVNLDGSCSSDTDNNISTYQWTKISGPSSFTITNSYAIQTQVSNLIEGIYQFELRVTDATGLFSKDTVEVTVKLESDCGESNRAKVAVRLTPVGTLSKPRQGMAAAAAGNKILFAGGKGTSDCPECFGSSQVDIYDVATNTWSTANLSVGRWSIGVVAAGNNIFFAGGQWGDGGIDSYYDNVDIYDASTNTWKLTHLSEARGYVAAGAVGDKVFFAGGEYNQSYNVSSVVDIYDIPTGSFSQFTLSHPRSHISAVTANNKIYFAGGSGDNQWYNLPSAVIDIFDNSTSQWTTSSLIQPTNMLTGTTMGDEIYWASNCTVEIKNINTWGSSIAHPFKNISSDVQAVKKDNFLLFIGGWRGNLNADYANFFDIYNTITKTWTVGVSPVKIQTAVSHNNNVYITDGENVYKMDF